MKSQHETERLFRLLFSTPGESAPNSQGDSASESKRHSQDHDDHDLNGGDGHHSVERRKKTSAFQRIRRSLWSKSDLDHIEIALHEDQQRRLEEEARRKGEEANTPKSR